MKEPELYIDTPGTWLTFDFDNHPGMVDIILYFKIGNWNHDVYSWVDNKIYCKGVLKLYI